MAEMEAWERKSREVERSKGKQAERSAEVDEVCFILHGFRPLRGPTFYQTAVVCPDAGAQVELAETLVKNAIIAVPPQTWNIDLADAQDPGLRISQVIVLQLFHSLLTLTSIDLYCTNTHKYSHPSTHTYTHTHVSVSAGPDRDPSDEELLVFRLGFIFLAYRIDYWWWESVEVWQVSPLRTRSRGLCLFMTRCEGLRGA